MPLEELSYNLRIRIISVENFEMFFGQYSNTVVTDTPFTYSVALRVYGPRSRSLSLTCIRCTFSCHRKQLRG